MWDKMQPELHSLLAGLLRLGETVMLTTLVLAAALTLGQTAEKSATDESLAAKVKQLVGKQGLGHDELANAKRLKKPCWSSVQMCCRCCRR